MLNITLSHRPVSRTVALAITAALIVIAALSINGNGSSAIDAQAATAAPGTPIATQGGSASTDNATIPLYGLFETQFDVTGTVTNPFDPAQIEVNAQFTAPDNSQIIVPAFWMQPYTQTCTQNCSSEVLQPSNHAGWHVRFTPEQIGAWSYTVQARDSASTQIVARGQFHVIASQNSGFIRVGANHHYFAYENKTAYFPVGSNLGWSWSGQNGTLGYQGWLRKLHESGANYGRLYIDVPWFIGLDWHNPVGNYTTGQPDSWRLDTILQTAEEQGIALQLVLVWHQGFSTYSGPPVNIPKTPARAPTDTDWTNNPFNNALGGPLTTPASFFATDQGRELLKRRLRYIVARWGYSTSVFSWEVIDQLDRITLTPDVATEWLTTMVNYLRGLDVYNHLITAGVRDAVKSSLLDPVVLDFKQTRFYQRRPIETAVDQVTGTLNALGAILNQADRPALLTEFSLNPWFEPIADDPQGVHVRETMWASALSGAAGGAASWYWDTYLFPANLTSMYAPLVAYSKGIPWNTANFESVDVALTPNANATSAATDPMSFQPFHVAGYIGTYNTAPGPDIAYRITPEGVIPPINTASSYLYGHTYNAQFNRAQKYIIAPPTDTTLTVTVKRASDTASARLVVQIDGKIAGAMLLSQGSKNVALIVPITAGQHTVTLDNQGDDYLQLDSLDIAAYITPLRSLALADRKAGIFLAWFQNRSYTWETAAKNLVIPPVTVKVRVASMPAGVYQVELWDPFSGNVVGQENITVTADGNLSVDLLPITKMLALRALRLPDAGAAATPSANNAAKTPAATPPTVG